MAAIKPVPPRKPRLDETGKSENVVCEYFDINGRREYFTRTPVLNEFETSKTSFYDRQLLGPRIAVRNNPSSCDLLGGRTLMSSHHLVADQ
jgi:hypothetical protein